jgi:phosphate transport system substrate-binding protein
MFFACNNSKQTSENTSSVKVVVDESFAPIIEDQYIVFESTYPNNLDLIYKPEVQLLNLLISNSVQLVIMSRKLLPNEEQIFKKKGLVVRSTHLATDAIALITHRSETDTTITVDEIISTMKGSANGRSLVFDNPNSSTVRYLKELAGIQALPKQGIYALKNSTDVIKWVHNNPGSIGVIGYNWMKQPPQDLETIVKDLRLMSVKQTGKSGTEDKFYKPNQNNLALGLYPLSRELFFIDCQGGTGTSSFAAFIAGERGQRIMLKSGLLPDSIPPREIIIRKELTK